jgi:hypothetical protein
MTTQQQNIIDSLVAEFNKINKPTPSGFARIGEAIDKCDEWTNLVQAIQASNTRFKHLREQMVETDYGRLVEECRLAGLRNIHITMDDDSITLDIVGRRTDHKIKINYRFKSKKHYSDTGKSVEEFNSIRLTSYEADLPWVADFISIDSLFQHDRFFNAWTKLVEISRK